MGNPEKNYQEPIVELPSTFVPGKIGIVTVTFGSGDVLPEFLASLNTQSYRNFILIAVDNQSKDTTLDQLRAYSGSEILLIANDENVGVAAGNNQGIRAALETGCEHVLILNNDVAFEPDLLGKLVKGLDKYNCQMTTPMIYYMDFGGRQDVIWNAGGAFTPKIGYRPYQRGYNEPDIGQFSSPDLIDYAPTCCVLVRREVFKTIGLMDERYFVYYDDVDFMYRTFRAGVAMRFLPEAKLWHKVNALTQGPLSDFTLYYNTRGRTLFLTKHFGSIRGLLWTIAYSGLYLLRPMLGKDTWRLSAIRRKGTLDGRKVAIQSS